MKITICGSIKFAPQLVEIHGRLKKLGHEPLMHDDMFGLADGTAKQLKEEKTEGKVLSVGSGKVLESGKVQPLEVKSGDKVIFGKYAGDELLIDGKKCKILKESEILAVYEG